MYATVGMGKSTIPPTGRIVPSSLNVTSIDTLRRVVDRRCNRDRAARRSSMSDDELGGTNTDIFEQFTTAIRVSARKTNNVKDVNTSQNENHHNHRNYNTSTRCWTQVCSLFASESPIDKGISTSYNCRLFHSHEK